MKINNQKFEIIEDNRGKIIKIAKNVDVLRITSKKNTKRASHYHKKSSHICVLISGEMLYYERPTDSNIKPIKIKIKPGDYFITKNMIDHLMVFNKDSIFDCYSFGSRNKMDYEKDLVRLDYDMENLYNNWKVKI